MAQNNYIKDIISLYEASKKLETAQFINEEEIIPEQDLVNQNNGEEIVNNDAESSVYNQVDPAAQVADETMPQEETYPEQYQGLEDTSYLDNSEEKTNDIDPDEQENKKLLRLFDLFKNLLVYGKEFKNSLEFIDCALLEIDEIKEISRLKMKIDKLTEKVDTYLELNFSQDKYEKSLYLYIMLRTELLIMVKELRRILKLNEENNK